MGQKVIELFADCSNFDSGNDRLLAELAAESPRFRHSFGQLLCQHWAETRNSVLDVAYCIRQLVAAIELTLDVPEAEIFFEMFADRCVPHGQSLELTPENSYLYASICAVWPDQGVQSALRFVMSARERVFPGIYAPAGVGTDMQFFFAGVESPTGDEGVRDFFSVSLRSVILRAVAQVFCNQAIYPDLGEKREPSTVAPKGLDTIQAVADISQLIREKYSQTGLRNAYALGHKLVEYLVPDLGQFGRAMGLIHGLVEIFEPLHFLPVLSVFATLTSPRSMALGDSDVSWLVIKVVENSKELDEEKAEHFYASISSEVEQAVTFRNVGCSGVFLFAPLITFVPIQLESLAMYWVFTPEAKEGVNVEELQAILDERQEG